MSWSNKDSTPDHSGAYYAKRMLFGANYYHLSTADGLLLYAAIAAVLGGYWLLDAYAEHLRDRAELPKPAISLSPPPPKG